MSQRCASCTLFPMPGLGYPQGDQVNAVPRQRALDAPSPAHGSAVCLQSAPEQPGPVPEQCVEKGGQELRGARAGGAEPGKRLPHPCRLGPPCSTMSRLLPILLLAALGCAAKLRRQPAAWDDSVDAQRAPAAGCANLTLVLDNWKFAITSQMRNLLLFDHQTVLPDYGRIRSLSGALDELYRDFSALKEQLGRLSARFAEVEAFVDQLSRARGPGTLLHRRGPPQPARSPLEPPRSAGGGVMARRAPA
ncbi:uncharacterized protein [Melanerpes formicivorus]|uniref:uncharacterized protein n=1 Tax=Melanerpes formicivorus TaxID=211600 RepID=UPI00358E029F